MRVIISQLALLSCLALVSLFQLIHISNATNTLNAGQLLKDWQVLESPNQIFRFGFFNSLYSSNRYLTVRCMDFSDQKMVWVANRENPLNDTSGYLNFTRDGFLVISDERGASITVNSGQALTHPNTTLVLLDSGNLVLKAGRQVVWQSFDYPTDTILPGMKIGFFNLKNQTHPRTRFLTSWLDSGDPSPGAFTLGVDPNNTKKLEVLRRGTPYWRSLTWKNKNQMSFPFQISFYFNLEFSYTSNENESYFSCKLIDSGSYSFIEINSTGNVRIFYGMSGGTSLYPAVTCDDEKKGKNSEGCIEQKSSNCSAGDEFELVFALMNTWSYSERINMSMSDCKEECRNNCSCFAYTSTMPYGSSCMFSNGHALDVPYTYNKEFFYKRKDKGASRKKQRKRVMIVSVVSSLALLVLACALFYILQKYCLSKGKTENSRNEVGQHTQIQSSLVDGVPTSTPTPSSI